jgi:hypothetical protein
MIISTMARIIDELSSLGKKQMDPFCPLESVILYYMIECIENGKYQKITINDIYNIIDTYAKVFDSSATGHKKCRCNELFICNKNIASFHDKYHKYLQKHYDRVNHTSIILDDFTSKHPKVNWLYSHPVYYGNKENSKFYIGKHYNLLGYDNDSVYIFNIKTQFNEINYNQFMVDSICDTWLISNVSNDSPNFKRFSNKSIKSCVISLDQDKLYIVDWTKSIKDNQYFMKKILYNILEEKFKNKHQQYYNTFMNIIEKKKKITEILDDCNKKCEQGTYISDFWKRISHDIDILSDKKEKISMFKSYMDENNFIRTIEGYLNLSLKKLLLIKNEEAEKDEDEDKDDDDDLEL